MSNCPVWDQMWTRKTCTLENEKEALSLCLAQVKTIPLSRSKIFKTVAPKKVSI